MDQDGSGDVFFTERAPLTTSTLHTAPRPSTASRLSTTTPISSPRSPTEPSPAQLEGWGMFVVFILVCFFLFLLGRWCLSLKCKKRPLPRKLPVSGTVLNNMVYANHTNPGQTMREQLLADNDDGTDGDDTEVVYARSAGVSPSSAPY